MGSKRMENCFCYNVSTPTFPLVGNAKGGIYENLIAYIFIKKGYKLNYFKSDNKAQEVEFLPTQEASIVPVEVKSNNGATVSLNEMSKRPDIKLGFKLISGNAGVTEKKVSCPLYMAMFL